MHFRKLDDQFDASSDRDPTCRAVFESLDRNVLTKFERMASYKPTVVPIDCPGHDDATVRNRLEASCTVCQACDECRASWSEHVAQLRRRPQTHWHECEHGALCAVVPLVSHGRCLAALKLVSSSDRNGGFLDEVEMLDILLENFVHREQELLDRLAARVKGDPTPFADAECDSAAARLDEVDHPQIQRAIEHIESHLSDVDLSVADTADRLGMNATYLAHLFSTQVGQRMSRYIASRRVEQAKRLLESTNWQIKRVAFETGHASADWFSQVFRAYAGCSPREYRRRTRS
jgi:AraC-like DNA-binding protein